MPLTRLTLRCVLATALTLTTLSACDSDGDGDTPASGTVTFSRGEGVDLTTGRVQTPGNFQNSDLFASANGDHLRLASGGDSPVSSRPVNWFLNSSGLFQHFDSLAEVPEEIPSDDQNQPLVRTEAGNGFVVQTMRGTWSRGWISHADSRSLTIEFEPVHDH